MSSRYSSERGAILIHVAVASVVLIAFSMFVIDYGVMWVSRGQAQNAADSGALAGAVAMAFDDFGNRADDGPAKQAAQQFALLNKVYGEDPDVQVATDVIFYPDDPSKFPASCADDSCIRVDVYRNQARANPLPMYFGQLVGLTDQGVRATATAQVLGGNAAECVKPWVVADRWDENADGDEDFMTNPPTAGDPSQTTPFNDDGDADPDLDDGEFDHYVHVNSSPPGTGYALKDDLGNWKDYGYQFILRMSNPGGGGTLGVRSPGWVMTIDLPNDEVGGGQSQVGANISGCTDATVKIAEPQEDCLEPTPLVPDPDTGRYVMSCIGVQPGNAWNPQEGELENWITDNGLQPEDLDDVWLDYGNGGCANPLGCPSSGYSRRIIPLALFDPEHYAMNGFTGSTGVVKVTNILGFFVQGTCDGNGPINPPGGFSHEPYLECATSGPQNELVGRLVSIPGLQIGGGGAGPGSFTLVTNLIR